ncbi:MAG: hypothetical protein KF699_08425 [Phycisphaeraceae bacterium]|nr:hypothetical protein [Phycisphaeraceae bacterium]MBX3406171.1 hypothetical protein [Phycisphaeraceae bacterium]
MFRNFCALAAFSGVVVCTSFAHAGPGPLNLTPGTPDVASGFVSVSYNAQSMILSVSGFTQNLNLPPSSGLNNREFSIVASIDNSGAPIAGGTYSMMVRGDFGGTDQVLFQSNTLWNFGSGAVDLFEFIFIQESGSLAAPGTHIGTILAGNFGSFPGGVPNFSQSFSNVPFPGFPGSGNADTFVIPTPTAAAMFAVAGFASLRRRRSN